VRVVILVLSKKDDGIYCKLESSIRSTWGSYKSVDIDIFYYYGDSDKFEVVGDRIYSNYPDLINNIGYKTIDAFDYLYNNIEFDYLYRTNSSSYVNIEKMLDFLKEKPPKEFYSARVNIENKSGIKFGSGSGYFLSRDLVRFVIENKKKWNHNLIDDVALGDLLLNNNFYLTPSYRLDIDELKDEMFFNSVPIDIYQLDKNFHFRCKSKDVFRETDVRIMRYLYNYFNSKDSIV
jgi:hypothetical protein